MASESNSSGNDLVVSTLGAALTRANISRNSGSNTPIVVNIHGDVHIHNSRGTSKKPSDQSYSKKLSGSWTTSNGLSLVELRSELQDHRQQGYQLTNLVGYEDNGSERYLTLWVKDTSVEWAAMQSLSKDEYLTAVKDFKPKGFQLTKVCGYVVDDTTKFAAIWEKRKGPLVLTKVNMNSEMFDQDFDNYDDLNCRMVYLNAYAVKNETYFAAIWEQSSASRISTPYNYPSSKLHEKCTKKFDNGFTMNAVFGYCLHGKDYYGALFEKRTFDRAMHVNWGYSSDQYLNKLDKIIAQQFTPTYVNAFASGSTVRYCIMWDE